jgi:hypothetical protein
MREASMSGRGGLLLALVAAVLSACASRQVVMSREDLLVSAGFTARPADTPARQAALRALPANRFVQQGQGDRAIYLYADPLVCNCLYIGDQAAYGRFRQDASRRQVASERLLAAQINADTALPWGPEGPWGPGF